MLLCPICARVPSRELAKALPGRSSILPAACGCGTLQLTGGPSQFSWFLAAGPELDICLTSEGRMFCGATSTASTRSISPADAPRVVRAIMAQLADLGREYTIRRVLES